MGASWQDNYEVQLPLLPVNWNVVNTDYFVQPLFCTTPYYIYRVHVTTERAIDLRMPFKFRIWAGVFVLNGAQQ